MDPRPTKLAQASPSGAQDLVLRVAGEDEVPRAVEIDNEACLLYAQLGAGYAIDLPNDHPFVVREIRGWTQAARNGRLCFACASSGEPVGFAAVGWAGERPYLDPVSVRQAWMRRGVGKLLLAHAQRWSAHYGELWLTTYDSVPWNRPWYERLGFAKTPESEWNSALRAIIQREQAKLPHPADRVVMVYRHPAIR